MAFCNQILSGNLLVLSFCQITPVHFVLFCPIESPDSANDFIPCDKGQNGMLAKELERYFINLL